MDLQTLLTIILILLALNLIAVGIYIVLILKEFQQTVKKANLVLDNVHDVTDAISNPVTTLVGIVNGITQSVGAVKAISSLWDDVTQDSEETDKKRLKKQRKSLLAKKRRGV